MNKPLHVLYVGSYKPSYPRNKIFIDGLRKNMVTVTEINERSPVRLAYRIACAYGSYDVMLVGFSGQEKMPLARLLSSAPVVFDVFTSHYMGYILDRRYFSKSSLRAKWYRFLDRWSCKLAHLVILDTQAHIDFFVKEFGLPKEKFARVFLGANTDLHTPKGNSGSSDPFDVLFWGSFIPLQGTEYIVRAASLLKNEPIVFTLIGTGQTRDREMALAKSLGLSNIVFPGKVSDQELVFAIEKADICLGAFGGGIKADITIQNKIFETLASKKPLLTAQTAAIGELLQDGYHCLLCHKADPEDLAKKIVQLKSDPDLRTSIAERGHQLFQEKLTEEKIGADLVHILTTVHHG